MNLNLNYFKVGYIFFSLVFDFIFFIILYLVRLVYLGNFFDIYKYLKV